MVRCVAAGLSKAVAAWANLVEIDPQETSASIWREWVSPYRLIA